VPQGSQIFLRDSASALRNRGHDVRVVVYGHGIGEDPSDMPIHRAPRLPGVRRTAAGPSIAKPLLDLLLVNTLRRVVRAQRVDVVAVHNYEALIVALAARVRSIVYFAHNAMADELPYHLSNPEWSATFGRWMDETFPRRADAVIAPHERLRDYLIECGCTTERVHVVPPLIRLPDFDPPEPARTDCPVLYTGNLDEYQNLDLLYRAMDGVLAEEPGTQLVIATPEPRPVDRDFVRFVTTPDWDAVARELRRDVVFVCPRASWSGYPVKLLNAMAAGLPIVCAESAAYPVTHQFDGLVVPDNDVPAMTASILRLMRDPELRATLGRRAQETWREKLDADVLAPRVEAVFRACYDQTP
jgi:glycosyltransferase involved in cell wall biosynthesis